MKLDNRITELFKFLENNREYNTSIQLEFYSDTLLPHNGNQDKLKSLLYRIQSTQSRPKLSLVSAFWKKVSNSTFDSMEQLIVALSGEHEVTYNMLFKSLLINPSWGNKTSALFAKSLYHLHTDPRYYKLSFLEDAPQFLSDADRLYLPVDQVIHAIFCKLTGQKHVSFNKINNTILKDYSGKKMEIWDDLWFWGFISQKGSGSNRSFEWNEDKYWSLLHTPKDKHTINQIRNKVKAFLKILG